MSKKKVLVWETSASVAGGQKMTLTVMELLKEDYQFHCLIPGEGALSQRLTALGIPYTVMGDQTLPVGVKGVGAYFRYAWLSLKNIAASMKAIRRVRPDILYAPGPAALPWSAVCGTLSGKPVVWHLHHLFADGPTKKLLSLTAKWRSVKRIVAVSQIVGDQITPPQGREKIIPIYNPIDIDRYANGDRHTVRGEIEAALGVPAELVLLETAVLRPTKRQELFIRVIAALKEKNIPVTGVLLGDAITPEDQEYKSNLLELTGKLGLQRDIYFAGHRQNVGDFLAAADLVFVPSDVEGLSLAAQEAMAAKRYIIATDAGGVAELLSVADCGTLFSHTATPEQIADIIAGCLATHCEEQIERGYRFLQDCGPDSYREKLREVFSL